MGNEPQLNSEQKLDIRNAQLQIMSLKEQARQTQDQATAIEKSLVDYLNGLVVAMKVDTSKYAFNISSLAFYEKTPIAAPTEAPVEAPSEAQ